MKLLFPNSEHGPVDLKEGLTRVGSDSNAEVTIVAPGIEPMHCEIHSSTSGVLIKPCSAQAVVVINGKQISGEVNLKAGDLVLFSRVGARVVAGDRVGSASAAVAPKSEHEDDGRTRIRMALPKYMLRGVSGSTFGKNFPIFGTMTVGRHSDCDISIPGEEISRHHVKLQVTPDGLAVEDLGSANGTFIGDKRVHHGTLKPGEELRLDTLRFLLVAPTLETQGGGVKATPAKSMRFNQDKTSDTESKKSPRMLGLVVLLVVIACVVGLYFSGAF